MEYGARDGAVGPGTAIQARRSRVRLTIVTLEFFIDIIIPAALWPWGRFSLLTEMSARNIHVPIIMKFGSLNLLEPSGRVQDLLYLLPYGEHPCQSCYLFTEAR